MIPTVFPCYAPKQREIAKAIATLLERCGEARVFLEEGRMRSGEDLAAKAREGRTADIVLVLFSRDSAPPRWPRAQWEDAFIHEPAAERVRIGFIRCDESAPPRVLKPQFDGRTSAGFRELKRWVRNRAASWEAPAEEDADHAGELEALALALADRPGNETAASLGLAYRFARDFREDFDEIFRLECGDRSLAALAGELAAQLGLRLEGDLDANLERLRGFCSARRFLLLLEGAGASEPRELAFGGLCSTLFCTEPAPTAPEPDSLRAAQAALANPSAY
ncbi:MAG: toll/interleukin-1 receptor domain-containing protein, partial [Acidobacteriia bacterium]|nr:toll/interleukin-1 receptor domain-containing protein [Terriglobia bacterium]